MKRSNKANVMKRSGNFMLQQTDIAGIFTSGDFTGGH